MNHSDFVETHAMLKSFSGMSNPGIVHQCAFGILSRFKGVRHFLIVQMICISLFSFRLLPILQVSQYV